MVSSSQRRTPLLWHLALLAIVALFLSRAASGTAPLDAEATLSLSYAQSLADGHGLVLHAHAERVEGPQSLLWTLTLAALKSLGFIGESAAVGLSALCVAVALFVTAKVPAAMHQREARWFDLVAPLVGALVPSVVAAAGSALDFGLYAAIAMIAVLALAREEHDRERYPWSALAFIALFLTRPAAVASIVAVGACKLLRDAAPSRPRRQDVLWLVSIVVGLFAITLFRLAYFGALLPNGAWSSEHSVASLIEGRRSALASFTLWLRAENVTALFAIAVASLFGARPHSARVAPIVLAFAAALSTSAIDRERWQSLGVFASAALLLTLASAEGARGIAMLVARLTPRIVRPALAVIATPLCVAALVFAGPLRFRGIQRAPSARAAYSARALVERARSIGVEETASVAACADTVTLDTNEVALHDLSGRADASFVRAANRRDDVLFARRPPTLVVLSPSCHQASWLRSSAELRSGYVLLGSDVWVRRAAIAAPFHVGAARRSASAGLLWSTLSHEHAAPAAQVAVELTLTRDAARALSTLFVIDDTNQTPVERRSCELDRALDVRAFDAGERPRILTRFAAPNAGRYRLVWRSATRDEVEIGRLIVSADATQARCADGARRIRAALDDERYDLAWSIVRSLSLRLVMDRSDACAREALASFARALAERAKLVADARAWALAADIAESARTLAPEDRRTLSLCSEVSERLADAASDEERANRAASAMLLAQRAIEVDPRRSWSRRRVESLRDRVSTAVTAAQRSAAYRAATNAVVAGDGPSLDRAMVALAAAHAWLEAARLAEHTGHTPRDPAARVAAARGLLAQGRAREALALVSGVPCAEASDREVTRALRSVMGPRAYRPFDGACREE